MTEQMMAFLKLYGIEIPKEIDQNPYEGLNTDEIKKIKYQLGLENIPSS